MIFLEALVKKGILKEEQVNEVIRIAKEKYEGSIDQSLLEFSLDEKVLLETKGEVFDLPIRDLDPKTILPETLRLIPVDTARIYHFVPIGSSDDTLEVGMIDPDNVQAIDVLTFITSRLNKSFKLFLIRTSVYNQLLKMYDGLGSEVDQALSELDTEIGDVASDSVLIEKDPKTNNLKPGEEEKIVEDAPIIKIVAVILRHATEGGASDIHIENVGDKVKVRFRVDGILHTSLILPLNVYSGVVARIKILAKLRIDEKRKPQDGGFGAKIDGRKIDFRVSTMPSYYGEKVVMRILDSQKGVQPLEDLDMSPENLSLIREALEKPYGLILITGPTGSDRKSVV